MPRVVVLAPMPLERDALVAAFRLPPDGAGRVGGADVSIIHTGMGPPLARAATERVLAADGPPVDHVIVAGICGGLDPSVPVGTPINPERVVDFATGAAFVHRPPLDGPPHGTLITTEGVSLDLDLARRLFEDGCIAVDMETAAIAEVCEAHGCPWSVYRCISDRPFDGLLDERIVALTNPDGSARVAEIAELLASDPALGRRLEQLGRDTAVAARRAAEAALAGCLALSG